MLIKRRVYFSAIDEETGEERLFSTNTIMSEEDYLKTFSDTLEQREYGMKSKALAFFAPGAYQAKEAAKYGYDDENEYKKVRGKYALKGAFAPGVSTYMKKAAEKMHKEGKSTDEIREFLENKGKYHNNARVAAGIGEALTGSMGGVGHAAATAVGAYDALEKNRKKFKED